MDKKLLAFTLIELLVVIAIIGILSGLIVVTMNGVTSKANVAKAQAFSSSLRNALMLNTVGEWKLDEGSGTSANDTWTRINNGSVVALADTTAGYGDDPTHTDGWMSSSGCVSGTCLKFDGSDDYISCGTNSSLDFGNGTSDSPFTLAGWFKLSDATNKGLMGKYFGGHQYLIFTSSLDRLHLEIDDISASSYIGRYYSTPITPYENQWTYFAATYDGSSSSSGIKIYINGTRVDDNNFSSGAYTAMEQAGTSFRIGMYGSGTYISGLVDDIRVFNAAVPSSQIKEQYYAGLNGLYVNGGIAKEEYFYRIERFSQR